VLSQVRLLICPHCRRPRDLFSVLDHCAWSWPGRNWIDFCCPDCHLHSHLALEGRYVAIGRVEERPAPHFEPQMRVDQPGLHAQASPDGLLVRLQHRRWFLVARAGNP
jgi:hypothetical protein